MKLVITLVLILSYSVSFSQWTRVQQLPASNIFTLFHKDSVLYAGGTNVIYVSKNKGQTWDSTTAIPELSPVSSIIDHIIVYKNELYVSAPSKKIFKSPDAGTTWQNISAGIDTLASVSDFCEFKGNLYASTEGNLGAPIFKLDPANRTNWLPFSNGLSSISTVVNSIVGAGNVLIAGTNNNSLYDYLPPNSTMWEERFLTNPPIINEGVFDIITAHDTLFLPGKTGFFYMSTNNGQNWNFFGSRLVTGATSLVNAKQGLISSRYIFDGVSNTTLFYYIKKDSLQFPFHNFSVVPNHFTWKLDIAGDKLWDASDRGLFFMSLSDLPGISAADDSAELILLPVRFVSYNATCEKNRVLINWKTAQEQTSNHFSVERSVDGISWTAIGNIIATGSMTNENSYSFSDNEPVQNCFYRIAGYDSQEKIHYSGIIKASCSSTDIVSLWPNPVSDMVFLNISTGINSKLMIKIFDSKGVLIKTQSATVLRGSNQIRIDMKSLIKGMYLLSAEWNNGQMRRAIQVLKQ